MISLSDNIGNNSDFKISSRKLNEDSSPAFTSREAESFGEDERKSSLNYLCDVAVEMGHIGKHIDHVNSAKLNNRNINIANPAPQFRYPPKSQPIYSRCGYEEEYDSFANKWWPMGPPSDSIGGFKYYGTDYPREADYPVHSIIPQQHLGFDQIHNIPHPHQQQSFSYPYQEFLRRTAPRNLSTQSSSQFQQISVKLVQVGNSLHLAPVQERDAQNLFEISMGIQAPKPIVITLQPGLVLEEVKPVPIQPVTLPPPPPLPTIVTVTHPKHIYKTSSDTYRVQVGKGSKQQRNGKFSRNCVTETEALWLCELALIVIDGPSRISEIVRIGNYKTLLQRGMVTSENDFAFKLVAQAEHLQMRGLLKDDECDRLVQCFQAMFPPETLAIISSHNAIFKTRTGQDPSELVPGALPKKRRRSSHRGPHNSSDKPLNSVSATSSSSSTSPSPDNQGSMEHSLREEGEEEDEAKDQSDCNSEASLDRYEEEKEGDNMSSVHSHGTDSDMDVQPVVENSGISGTNYKYNNDNSSRDGLVSEGQSPSNQNFNDFPARSSSASKEVISQYNRITSVPAAQLDSLYSGNGLNGVPKIDIDISADVFVAS